MKKIIVLIEPFDYNIKLYAYEGNSKLEEIKTDLEHLNPRIFVLVDKYDAEAIDIKGPHLYCANILDKLNTYYAASKYAERKIEIKLI